MTLTLYATQVDLAGEPWDCQPDNPDRLLTMATIVVARACNRNPYTDAPSAADAAPLRDATCAQAAMWAAAGVDPATLVLGGPAPVKSSKVLTGEVTYDTTAQTAQLAAMVDGELSMEAEAILQAAGLLWVPVPSSGGDGRLPSWGLDTPRPRWPYGTPEPVHWPYS